jgi:hypothetical protein
MAIQLTSLLSLSWIFIKSLNWLRLTWACLLLSGLMFMSLTLTSPLQVSREEHKDLQRRVEGLETQQSRQDAQIYKNTQRIDDMIERIDKMESTSGHELIFERVTRLETISQENQTMLRGVVIGLILWAIQALYRAIFGAGAKIKKER